MNRKKELLFAVIIAAAYGTGFVVALSGIGGTKKLLLSVCIVAVLAAVYAIVCCRSRRQEGKHFADLDYIDSLDGYEFEAWCAALLEKLGYTDIDVTPKSGDHGADVLAEKHGERYAFQCKRYEEPVGNSAVQEIHFAKSYYHCTRGAVITNNYFTDHARQDADAVGIELWDRDTLRRLLFET